MTDRQNKWIKKKIYDLKIKFGGKCWNCGSTSNLEFAHIKDTELNGMGRGRKERYNDIIKHPDCYALLCGGESSCHVMFDNGLISLDKFYRMVEL